MFDASLFGNERVPVPLSFVSSHPQMQKPNPNRDTKEKIKGNRRDNPAAS